MEIRGLREDDLEQAWALDRDAFHTAPERREEFLRWADPRCFVGAFDSGRLVAQCAALPFGQFFGGRAVPMGGLSSVAVAPDRRGSGLAKRVIGACLASMRERGQVISTLFPATTRLYRALDWEMAGSTALRSVAPRALQALPRPESARVRPGSPGDLAAIRDCYAEVARETPGFVERPESWWGRRSEQWKPHSVFVAEDRAGDPCGYLVYRQLDGPHSQLGGSFEIQVMEWLARDADAALALWRLLGSWASVVECIHYRSAAEDPILLLLPEQDVRLVAEVRWMTRILDASAAVAARGFPPGLELEAELELRDPLLPDNDGRFALRVGKGRGHLAPGGRGALRLDVGAFASLFTGWASPAGLARAGRLEGGAPEERAALAAAFAGPVPWMLDEF